MGELEQNAAMANVDHRSLEPGLRWLTIVRQIEPGVRVRVFVQGPGAFDTDVNEAEAENLFRQAAPPGSRAATIERQMRAAIAKMKSHN